MRRLILLLLPAALLAGQPRYARLGDFQGPVEVQLTAADPWIPAERNLPLPEAAWVRTGPDARLEIEFDDGSAWRLGPDSQGEISDYSRLSTGQRITLLSLDHGSAYFTGQPSGNDVVMLVMPGAQMTVLQGSRIRETVEPAWSQVAVLEGQVRFSSPAAEMDIREGTTARVEPANAARFFLYPEVTAEALDRWNEERDKLQARPASAVHVTARYGLADLDAGGSWFSTPTLGFVWKPEADAAWVPYQKGRWRYYDTLGYTWVSSEPWGWLPYHNGRWAKLENIGWVWQPTVSTTFHPSEVYWMRGATFTGWGPLGPGEVWNEPKSTASTTYAAFQPDVRTIDPEGFPAPTPEQLKTATFVPALPSPAFLTWRLDATRPVLRVGSTRIVPTVPRVTFGDGPITEPPSDLMTNPVNDPPPAPPVSADASAGATPPPDGVYPVPTIAVPIIEVPVFISPSDHPDYSRRPGRQNGGNQPNPTVPTAAPVSAANSKPVATSPNRPVNGPARQQPQSNTTTTTPPAASTPAPPTAATPVNRPPGNEPIRSHPPAAAPAPTPPATPPKVNVPKDAPAKVADKKIADLSPAEVALYNQVLRDVSASAPNYTKALADLDAWSAKFPNSPFQNDRLYYYIHAYNGMARSDKVLDTAAPLIQAGVGSLFQDQQQVLQILVAASSGVQKLPKPTQRQRAAGQRAARELLEFLPRYFDPGHKPADISDSAWSLARTQLESVAKGAAN